MFLSQISFYPCALVNRYNMCLENILYVHVAFRLFYFNLKQETKQKSSLYLLFYFLNHAKLFRQLKFMSWLITANWIIQYWFSLLRFDVGNGCNFWQSNKACWITLTSLIAVTLRYSEKSLDFYHTEEID